MPRPAPPTRIDTFTPSSSDIHSNLCPNEKFRRQGCNTFLFRTTMAVTGDSLRDRSLLGSNRLCIAAQLNDRRKQGALVVSATGAFCLSAAAPLHFDVTTVAAHSGSTATTLKRPAPFVASPSRSPWSGFPAPSVPLSRAFLRLRAPASLSPGAKNPRRRINDSADCSQIKSTIGFIPRTFPSRRFRLRASSDGRWQRRARG